MRVTEECLCNIKRRIFAGGRNRQKKTVKLIIDTMGRKVLLLNASDCEHHECLFCILALDDPFQLECGTRICVSCAETMLLTKERYVTFQGVCHLV